MNFNSDPIVKEADLSLLLKQPIGNRQGGDSRYTSSISKNRYSQTSLQSHPHPLPTTRFRRTLPPSACPFSLFSSLASSLAPLLLLLSLSRRSLSSILLFSLLLAPWSASVPHFLISNIGFFRPQVDGCHRGRELSARQRKG